VNVRRSVDQYAERKVAELQMQAADFFRELFYVRDNHLVLSNNVDGIPIGIVNLLAYWYSHQEALIVWHDVKSEGFTIGIGTKQGGVLSPYLFTCYIKDLLITVSTSRIGCNIGGIAINFLAYADDIVLMAPLWCALQKLLFILENCCSFLDVTWNAKKTVCMNFCPRDNSKIVTDHFPSFTLCGQTLEFVPKFCYLGHIINDRLSDDNDINREIRNMYVRTNMLI